MENAGSIISTKKAMCKDPGGKNEVTVSEEKKEASVVVANRLKRTRLGRG